MMKILVTGGAGFIGSSLADELLNHGHEVVVVDNFNGYYDVKRKEHNIKEAMKSPRYKLYRADITDKEVMERIFGAEHFDKVAHLAARAGVRPSLDNPYIYATDNYIGTLVMLELSRKHGVKSFIFASSSSVYGNADKVPFSENEVCDKPISPYAATKRACEMLCYTYHHLYNLSISCMRFFTVYGPRGRPDMAIYKFIDRIYRGEEIEIYGDGSTKRDYTYVSDIVNGIVRALEKGMPFGIYNLGNSKAVELRRLIEVIEKELGKKASVKSMPLQPGDVSVTCCCHEKASREIGYFPKVSIEEGIRDTARWYLSEEVKDK